MQDDLTRALAAVIAADLHTQCEDGLDCSDEYDPETMTLPWIEKRDLDLGLLANAVILFVDGWRTTHGK